MCKYHIIARNTGNRCFAYRQSQPEPVGEDDEKERQSQLVCPEAAHAPKRPFEGDMLDVPTTVPACATLRCATPVADKRVLPPGCCCSDVAEALSCAISLSSLDRSSASDCISIFSLY